MSGNLRCIAYLRVSTQRQGASGLGIDAQRLAVASVVDSRGGQIVAEYVEVESGKRTDRPELNAALAACKRIGATLIVAKADRLGRRASYVLSLIDNAGVPFVFAEMPHASELEIGIRAVIAQEEGRLISERTKAALAAAKSRGIVLGGPRTPDQYIKAGASVSKMADGFARSLAPVLADIQRAGIITLHGIADALNNRCIKTARGSTWRPTTVQRVINRLASSN